MSAIIWDDESRQFSVVEDQYEFSSKFNELKGKMTSGKSLYGAGKKLQGNTALISAVGAGVAGAGSAAIARAAARRKARRQGLSEEEVNAAGRKAAIIGGLGGAAVGGGLGYAGSKFGGGYLKKMGSNKLNQLNDKNNLNAAWQHDKRKHIRESFNSPYTPTKLRKGEKTGITVNRAQGGSWTSLGNGINSRESAQEYMSKLPVKQRVAFKKLMNEKGLHFSDTL